MSVEYLFHSFILESREPKAVCSVQSPDSLRFWKGRSDGDGNGDRRKKESFDISPPVAVAVEERKRETVSVACMKAEERRPPPWPHACQAFCATLGAPPHNCELASSKHWFLIFLLPPFLSIVTSSSTSNCLTSVFD